MTAEDVERTEFAGLEMQRRHPAADARSQLLVISCKSLVRSERRNRGSPAFGILVDHVAATLARHRKTQLFKYGTDFARS
jgi:hypothetical protein